MSSLAAASARIVAGFGDKVSGQEPDLAPLDTMIKRMKDFADAVVQKKEPSAAVEEASAGGDDSGGGGQGRSFGGSIGTRQQAIAQLEAIRAFFQATEPSSPVALLIDRVKRLAAMDFMQIMQNMAPAGLEEANRVLDHTPSEGESSSSSYDETSSE